mmetsp:Transcript_9543/g.22965  ORF Transcript_9543/g.22965 Transcript_9543/m.22965 type:complete len:128 (+) Transcript_9543:158-541(+)
MKVVELLQKYAALARKQRAEARKGRWAVVAAGLVLVGAVAAGALVLLARRGVVELTWLPSGGGGGAKGSPGSGPRGSAAAAGTVDPDYDSDDLDELSDDDEGRDGVDGSAGADDSDADSLFSDDDDE